MATRATAALLHTWQRHIKSHPATRGGGKLNGQSNVLPYVFARSVVSDTPQRLWLGARWTVAAQGPKGRCLMYVVQQAADPAISPHRGVSPRPLARSGALEYLNASMARYSRKTRTRTRSNATYIGQSTKQNSSSENPHKLCKFKPAYPKGTEVGKSSNA